MSRRSRRGRSGVGGLEVSPGPLGVLDRGYQYPQFGISIQTRYEMNVTLATTTRWSGRSHPVRPWLCRMLDIAFREHFYSAVRE